MFTVEPFKLVVNGKYSFFKLLVNGKSLFDEFCKEMKEVRDEKNIKRNNSPDG